MGTNFTTDQPELSQGIVPRVLEDVLASLQERGDAIRWELKLSYLEIYNEKVRDLLQDSDEHGKHLLFKDDFGNYSVKDLLEVPVATMAELATALAAGAARRTTAATNMNAVSSRSHAVITLKLQLQPGTDENVLPCTSLFRLVDLAGSERAKKTGAEGQRLREANNINQSLTTLGLCITALAEQRAHVPFRNSKLTQLLSNSLGGNSSTLMIACVSPADSNCEETLQTLRYASTAAHIENKPVVNADPVASSNVALRRDVALLVAELRRLYATGAAVSEALVAQFGLDGSTPACLQGSPASAGVPGMPAGLPAARPPAAPASAFTAGPPSASHAAELAALRAELATARAERDDAAQRLSDVSKRGGDMCVVANKLTAELVTAHSAADTWRWKYETLARGLHAPLPGTERAEDAAAADLQRAAADSAAEASVAAAGSGQQLSAVPSEHDVERQLGMVPFQDAHRLAPQPDDGDDDSQAAWPGVHAVRDILRAKDVELLRTRAQLWRATHAAARGAGRAVAAGPPVPAGADAGCASDEDMLEAAEHGAAGEERHAGTALHAEDEDMAHIASQAALSSELQAVAASIAEKQRLFESAQQAAGGHNLEHYETLKAKFKEEIAAHELTAGDLHAQVTKLAEELAAAQAAAGEGSTASSGVQAKDQEIKHLRRKLADTEKRLAALRRDAGRAEAEMGRLRRLRDDITSAKRIRVDLEKQLRAAAKQYAADRVKREREAARLSAANRAAQVKIARQAAELEAKDKALGVALSRKRLAASKASAVQRARAAAHPARAGGIDLDDAKLHFRDAARSDDADVHSLLSGVADDVLEELTRAASAARAEFAAAAETLKASGQALAGDDPQNAYVPHEAIMVYEKPGALPGLCASRAVPQAGQDTLARKVYFRVQVAAWRAQVCGWQAERRALAQEIQAVSAPDADSAAAELPSLKRRLAALTSLITAGNMQAQWFEDAEEAQRLRGSMWVSSCLGAAAAKRTPLAAKRLLHWLCIMLSTAVADLWDAGVRRGADGGVLHKGGSSLAAAEASLAQATVQHRVELLQQQSQFDKERTRDVNTIASLRSELKSLRATAETQERLIDELWPTADKSAGHAGSSEEDGGMARAQLQAVLDSSLAERAELQATVEQLRAALEEKLRELSHAHGLEQRAVPAVEPPVSTGLSTSVAPGAAATTLAASHIHGAAEDEDAEDASDSSCDDMDSSEDSHQPHQTPARASTGSAPAGTRSAQPCSDEMPRRPRAHTDTHAADAMADDDSDADAGSLQAPAYSRTTAAQTAREKAARPVHLANVKMGAAFGSTVRSTGARAQAPSSKLPAGTAAANLRSRNGYKRRRSSVGPALMFSAAESSAADAVSMSPRPSLAGLIATTEPGVAALADRTNRGMELPASANAVKRPRSME